MRSKVVGIVVVERIHFEWDIVVVVETIVVVEEAVVAIVVAEGVVVERSHFEWGIVVVVADQTIVAVASIVVVVVGSENSNQKAKEEGSGQIQQKQKRDIFVEIGSIVVVEREA